VGGREGGGPVVLMSGGAGKVARASMDWRAAWMAGASSLAYSRSPAEMRSRAPRYCSCEARSRSATSPNAERGASGFASGSRASSRSDASTGSRSRTASLLERVAASGMRDLALRFQVDDQRLGGITKPRADDVGLIQAVPQRHHRD